MPDPIVDPFLVLAASVHYAPGVYAVLVGSGMSTTAGLPTGWELTSTLAEMEAQSRDGRIPDDIAAWWEANKTVPLEYSTLMEAIAPTTGQRQALLRSLIEPSDEEIHAGLKVPGPAHHALAELVKHGHVRVIVTTNFDRLIETALHKAGIEEQMLSGPGDLPGMIPLQHAACTVIKLHGDYQQANLINTDAELAEYDPQWLELLRRVLAEYGLITVGWSGQSDTALRREIAAAAGQQYGCFFGARGELHPDLTALAVEGKATVVPVTGADEFFDKVAGTLTQVAQRPALPLRTSAIVGTVKRLISQDRVRIELRDVLLREARLLNERLGQIPAFSPEVYRVHLANIQQEGQPLAAAMAAGCFYAPQERRLWTDLFRLIAAQPQPMNGLAWDQGLALRRLPASMALYAGVLGSWAAGDALLITDLLRQPLRYNYTNPRGDLQGLASCPAFVALAPPEVVDIEALGMGQHPVHASNKIVEAIMSALADQFPVDSDFAAAFEEVEYLMALLQHNWHETNGSAGHQRWAMTTFHSGLIGIPGAYIGPQPEPVASRFQERPSGLDAHSFAEMFGGDDDPILSAVAAIAKCMQSGR